MQVKDVKAGNQYQLVSGTVVTALTNPLPFKDIWAVPVQTGQGVRFLVEVETLSPVTPPPTVEYQGIYTLDAPHDGSVYGQLGPKKTLPKYIDLDIPQYPGSSKMLRLTGILTFRSGKYASLQEVGIN